MNIGIDIGGTHTRIGIGSAGNVEKKADFPTGELKEVVAEIKRIVDQLAPTKDTIVGVACPGPIETKGGILRALPNLPTFHNQNLKEVLEKELGLTVKVGHDASLAALAESKYGAGKGKDPVLYYTVSTGIGTGLIYQGEIYKGVYNPEPGHQIVTGVNLNLEKVSSGIGLRELYGKEATDLVGTPEWDKALERLARGVTNSILHYSPEIVIIGGGLTSEPETFFEPLTSLVNNFLTSFPPPPIVQPGLGENSTLIGALELAGS